MLTVTVTVDLRAEHPEHGYDHADRHALHRLADLPNGARLVVTVGDRTLLTTAAVTWLFQHSRRLVVDINAASPHVARRWYDAISTGEVC